MIKNTYITERQLKTKVKIYEFISLFLLGSLTACIYLATKNHELLIDCLIK